MHPRLATLVSPLRHTVLPNLRLLHPPPFAHDGTGALVLGVLGAHDNAVLKDKRTPLDVGPLAELDEVLTTTSETERSEILCALLHILCDNAKKPDMAGVCLSAGLLESIVNDDVRSHGPRTLSP